GCNRHTVHGSVADTGWALCGTLSTLFADDAAGGQQAAQLGDDDLLALAIVLGDDVMAGGLVLAGQVIAVQGAQVVGGTVGGRQSDIEQFGRGGDRGGGGACSGGGHRSQDRDRKKVG